MRILIFNKYCPKHPLAGGAEFRLYEVMKRIALKGNKVYLVSAIFPGAKRKEILDGIHIYRIGLRTAYNTLFVHILGVFSMRRWVNRFKPEIIFEDISPLPWFSPLIVPKNKKVIIMHHLNGKTFFKTQSLIKAAIAYILEKSVFVLYKKERIIVINKYLEEKLKNEGFQDMIRIEDGVDTKKYVPNKRIKTRNPTVIFLGRLDKRKGAHLLLKTYQKVKESIPNVEYWIAGDGVERKKLEQMAIRIGELGHGIKFLGFKSGSEKIRIIQKSWLIAVPSLAEGYGLAVLEANACGVPAIANNVPGLSESVIHEKTGILVDCSNTEIFAKRIIEILKDKKRLDKMGGNARKFALNYSWDECAEKTLQVLKSAVKD
ncbi:MAG: glycosyltransferase family 4 protein [Candidatus Woesearchaeota archaeon]